MQFAWKHFLVFISLLPLVFTFQVRWAPYNRSQIGVMDLPTIEPVKLPPHCKSFDHICALEAQRRYSEAFERYEERYEACGDWGWTLEGDSHGLDAAVAFKTTPCGTRVIVKGSRERHALRHIEKECRILKRLEDVQERGTIKSCLRCFPTYYYFSNRSRACYSELVRDTVGLKLIVHESHRGKGFHHVHGLLLRGVYIIQVLRSFNIEHGDLTFRNILFTRTTTETGDIKHYNMTVIDFGASSPLVKPQGWRVHKAGNHGMSDLYAYMCSWGHALYANSSAQKSCHYVVPSRNDARPKTLLSAITTILMENANATVAHDFDRVGRLLHDAETF